MSVNILLSLSTTWLKWYFYEQNYSRSILSRIEGLFFETLRSLCPQLNSGH